MLPDNLKDPASEDSPCQKRESLSGCRMTESSTAQVMHQDDNVPCFLAVSLMDSTHCSVPLERVGKLESVVREVPRFCPPITTVPRLDVY